MAALSTSPISAGVDAAGPRSGFSAEFALLLACCRPECDPTAPELEVLVESVDWTKAVHLAEYHGTLPSLYPALRTARGVPPAILEDLRTRYEHVARKNLRFTAELFRILDCLEVSNIPAIPLKGPVLAESVYGDLALRDFSDLDILVRPEDVERVKKALQPLHYEPNVRFSPAEELAYLRSGYEYTFDGPAGRNLLEIQWDILPRFYAINFDCSCLFERAIRAQVAGREVRTLCPEDLFLTLCVHAAKHAWIRLCWLRDIAATVRTQPLDLGTIDERARQLGILRIVGVNLWLAHDLLGTHVPDSVAALYRSDRKVDRLAREVLRGLSCGKGPEATSPEYFRLMLRLRERGSDRMRFLYGLTFTPGAGEWATVRLPAPLFPLYRVVRIFRLAGKLFARTRMRRIRAD